MYLTKMTALTILALAEGRGTSPPPELQVEEVK